MEAGGAHWENKKVTGNVWVSLGLSGMETIGGRGRGNFRECCNSYLLHRPQSVAVKGDV